MEKFNALGDLSEKYQKYRSFQELEKNKVNKVKKIELMTTKFGKKFAVTFDKVDGIFHLPSRFDRLEEKDKRELLKLKNFGIIYRGVKTVGQFKNKTPIINFVQIKVKNVKNEEPSPSTSKVDNISDEEDEELSASVPKRRHVFSSSEDDDDDETEEVTVKHSIPTPNPIKRIKISKRKTPIFSSEEE